MSEIDSTIHGLPLLTAPSLADEMVVNHVSGGNVAKRMPLETAMNLILGSNPAFGVTGGIFKLLANGNANNNKIINLAEGTGDNDAIRYLQIKPYVQGIAAVVPGLPVPSDKGAFIRIGVPTINDPWGGFYLFYWCVDTSANTEISLDGNSIVTSSGAPLYFDGSVANIVNVIKDSGWVGKYFHVAVRYRNLRYQSGISSTGHALIALPGYSDIVHNSRPEIVTALTISTVNNRLYISAQEPTLQLSGTTYRLEMVMDNSTETEVTGNEEGLISFTNSQPFFGYDLPLTKGKYVYAHCRIVSRSFTGIEDHSLTEHSSIEIDTDIINDSFLDFIAARMSEKMQTQGGEPLKPKE